MASFENIFPTFLQKCAELHELLRIVAFMLFIVGTILFVLHGFSGKTLMLHMVRLFVLTALLVMLPRWGNEAQLLMQTSILNGLGVDPSNVQDQYNQLLVIKRDTGTDRSWWDILSDLNGFTVENRRDHCGRCRCRRPHRNARRHRWRGGVGRNHEHAVNGSRPRQRRGNHHRWLWPAATFRPWPTGRRHHRRQSRPRTHLQGQRQLLLTFYGNHRTPTS